MHHAITSLALVLLAASTAFAQSPSPATSTAAPVTTATAPEPSTSPAGLEHVEDFGTLDLEMTTVTDFGELNLEDLLNAQVETASKKSESISRAPAIIDVLTREELYALGVRDLYTALTYLPGIELLENYAGTTTLIFRGMIQEQYSVKLLLLVNGHPVYEPITSQFLLESIPLESIKRLEVIRGPGSVLYGTNAFAGVINVITETAKEGEVRTLLRAEAGQFTTVNGGAGNVGRAGDLAWAVFAGGQNTRGYPYVVKKKQNEDCAPSMPSGLPPEQLRSYDCLRPGDVSGELEYFNNYVNTFADVQYAGVRLQVGGVSQEKQKFGLLPNLRFNGTNEITHAYGDLSYRHDWDRFGFVVRAGANHDDLVWNAGVFPLPSFKEELAIKGVSDIYRAELSTSWHIVDQLTLDQGLSYDQVALNSFTFELPDGSILSIAPSSCPTCTGFEDYAQSTASYYGQLTWNLTDELSAIGGYRASYFQTDRTNIEVDAEKVATFSKVTDDPQLLHSPRFALVYAPVETVTVKALYGEAFRLPNLFESAGTLKQLIAPTPNIEPEKIRTYELGVDTRPVEWMSVRLNGYYSQLSDLITRRLAVTQAELDQLGGSNIGGLYDNVWNGTIYGAELSSRAILSEAWSVFGNLSTKQIDYEDIDSKRHQSAGPYRFPNMAPVTANGGVSWKAIEWLVLRPNAQYVGARGHSKAYTLANMVVDAPLGESVTLSAIGNNLLGTEYTYPEHVRRHVESLPGGPGRAFYGRLTASF